MSIATVELKGFYWEMKLPCGDVIGVSGPHQQAPQICPVCKKTFPHVSVVQKQSMKKHVSVG